MEADSFVFVIWVICHSEVLQQLPGHCRDNAGSVTPLWEDDWQMLDWDAIVLFFGIAYSVDTFNHNVFGLGSTQDGHAINGLKFCSAINQDFCWNIMMDGWKCIEGQQNAIINFAFMKYCLGSEAAWWFGQASIETLDASPHCQRKSDSKAL